MAEETDREEEILRHAQGLPPGPRRDAYLVEACEGDETLRREIEELLAAGDKPASVLQRIQALAAAELPTIVKGEEGQDLEQPGDTISHYKLLQRIGEGGFGVVYLAEQTKPVERRVALKVIKAGMDTRSVIARFEAERQALAMMDHPNIARVLDAGATDRGRPYFVMELVKGVPITDYCDQAELDTRQRLKLFQDVCSAVQHSHQKGVIHRDLKPSNVLVTLHSDRPVVKVIDFGVAKAIEHRLTEKTLFTVFGQMVGTPAYMSPEQAVTSGLDIDTRSDVFSLGVLLYELLTGALPFEAERLRSAGLDELRRIIREEEPPKPSTRLSTLEKEDKQRVAARRHLSPTALNRLLRGDLDWIVMKALEKERSRRYDSVGAFAQDVQRHLNAEPVTAGAPSRIYKLRKFVGRNRGAVGAGVVIFGLLVATVVLGFLLIMKSQDLKIKLSQQVIQEKQVTIEEKEGRREVWTTRFNSKLDELWNGDSRPGYVEIGSEDRAILLNKPIKQAPEATRLIFAVYTQKSPLDMKDDYIHTVDYLERTMTGELGSSVRIDFRIYRGYQPLIDALVEEKVSFARIGPVSYVEAKGRAPGLQLAAVQDEENEGWIFAREDSGLKPLGSDLETLRSLAGRKFAFGAADSTLSSMWPKKKFVEAGMRASDLGEGSAHLGAHDVARDEVLSRNFEVGAAKAAILKGNKALIPLVKMTALNPPWVAAGDVAPRVVEAFKASLLDLDEADLPEKIHSGFEGFMEPPGGDRYFDATREMMKGAEQFGSLASEADEGPARN